MPVINMIIREKVVTVVTPALLICGNSDYVIRFDFDEEWEAYETKTARFSYRDSYQDVVFTGVECAVPIIQNAIVCAVGVYAGDLHTTTPANVPCKKSILCGSGVPADPTPDVYTQIMELLNTQSDWNQNNETALDFIKNKPTKVSDFENDTGYVTAKHTHSLADIDEALTNSTTLIEEHTTSGTYFNIVAYVGDTLVATIDGVEYTAHVDDLQCNLQFGEYSAFLDIVVDYSIDFSSNTVGKTLKLERRQVFLPEMYIDTSELATKADVEDLTISLNKALSDIDENSITTVAIYSTNGSTFEASMHLTELIDLLSGDTPLKMAISVSKLRFVIVTFKNEIPITCAVQKVDFSQVNTLLGIILSTGDTDYLWKIDSSGNDVITKYYQ